MVELTKKQKKQQGLSGRVAMVGEHSRPDTVKLSDGSFLRKGETSKTMLNGKEVSVSYGGVTKDSYGSFGGTNPIQTAQSQPVLPETPQQSQQVLPVQTQEPSSQPVPAETQPVPEKIVPQLLSNKDEIDRSADLASLLQQPNNYDPELLGRLKNTPHGDLSTEDKISGAAITAGALLSVVAGAYGIALLAESALSYGVLEIINNVASVGKSVKAGNILRV